MYIYSVKCSRILVKDDGEGWVKDGEGYLASHPTNLLTFFSQSFMMRDSDENSEIPQSDGLPFGLPFVFATGSYTIVLLTTGSRPNSARQYSYIFFIPIRLLQFPQIGIRFLIFVSPPHASATI